MSIYGSQKLVHYLPLIEKIGNKEPIAPRHVQLIVSDLCNQDCSFCAYRQTGWDSNQLFGIEMEGKRQNNPPRMIPREKVHEIIRDGHMMGVKAWQFTGGGEPTVHPDLTGFFEDVLNRKMEFSLVSNGVRWSEKLISILTEATWVRVSLDAATKEVYTSVRRVSDVHFEKALSNIQLLATMKRTVESPLVLGVGFVVTKDNWWEVRHAAALAKDLGADNLRISAVFQPDNAEYFKSFHRQAAEACRKAKEENEDKNFKVFNMFGDRISDLEQGCPDYQRCGYQHLTTYIGGDQNVYRCCNTSYNDLGLLGSLKDRGFKDFWFDPETQDKLFNFDARSCHRCQFNGQNKFINYALEPNPPHVNFV